MSKDKGEDELKKGAGRLGDRFSKASSEEETDTGDTEAGKDESSTSESNQQEAEDDVDEWVPATIYLPESKRKEFRRFLKRLTLDHPEIEEADKRELHTGMVEAAMDHPEEVAEYVESLEKD